VRASQPSLAAAPWRFHCEELAEFSCVLQVWFRFGWVLQRSVLEDGNGNTLTGTFLVSLTCSCFSGFSYLQLQVVAAGGDAGQSSFSANSPPTTGAGFVALDVGELSSLAGDAGPPGTPIAPPRTPVSPRTHAKFSPAASSQSWLFFLAPVPWTRQRVVRSLSRKGDRKPADADANATAGTSVQTISALSLWVAIQILCFCLSLEKKRSLMAMVILFRGSLLLLVFVLGIP
jgi:hypothetical protein